MLGSRPFGATPLAAVGRRPSANTAAAAQTLSAVSQAARVDTRILLWNPADVGGPATVSSDRQTLTVGVAGGGRAAIGKADGVYQFEVVANRQSSTSAYIGVGTLAAITAGGPGANTDGSRATGYRADGSVWTNGAQVASGGFTWQTPQVVGVVVDYPANQLRFYVNGTLQSALTRTLTNFNGAPLYPMYGSGGGGVSGMTAKISGLNFAFPIAGASEWRPVYVGASAGQTLDGISQNATAGMPSVRAFGAAQTLGAVSQVGAVVQIVAVSGVQTLANVSQTAGTTVRVQASAVQMLAGVTQAAAAVVSGATAAFSASQALEATAQAASAIAIAKASAAQVLDGVGQNADGQALARAAGAQSLDAATSAATAIAIASAQAAQTLSAVAQFAAGTVADTVRRLVGIQILDGISQVALVRRSYLFERNERTVVVIPETRRFAIGAEAREMLVQPEAREAFVVPEGRRAAFFD